MFPPYAYSIFYGVIVASVVLIVVSVQKTHLEIQAHNECEMTYIYRPMNYIPFNVTLTHKLRYEYGLFLYNEGMHMLHNTEFLPNDIPVLFIPGSGGSVKQVRSMASVMQNKTESRSLPVRYRFFAVDFKEQLSFGSSAVLEYQTYFVIDAMKTIANITKCKKMVLFGHSFGGFVAMYAFTNRNFPTKLVDLVILKATPLSAPPIMVDTYMLGMYNRMQEYWLKNGMSKEHDVAVASFNGGMRDYVIPHNSTYMRNIINVDVSLIEGVSDFGTDHLAILWCNQVVRHVTRIMELYIQQYMNKNFNSNIEMLGHFYIKDRHTKREKYNILKFGERTTGVPIKLPVNGRLEKQTIMRKFGAFFVIQSHNENSMFIEVVSNCVSSAVYMRGNGFFPKKLNRAKNLSSFKIFIQQPQSNDFIHVVIRGPIGCDFDISTRTTDTSYWKWYEGIFRNTSLLASSFILYCMRFIVYERSIQIRDPINSLLTLASLPPLVIIFSNGGLLQEITPVVLGALFATFYWLFACFLGRYFTKINRVISYQLRRFWFWKCPILFVGSFFPYVNSFLAAIYLSLTINFKCLMLSIPISLPLLLHTYYTFTTINPADQVQTEYDFFSAFGFIIPVLFMNASKHEIPSQGLRGVFYFFLIVEDDGAMSDCRSDDPKKHAREQHNALERRRRDNIKDMYACLREVVPEANSERASRAVILKKSIESIQSKQAIKQQLTEDIQELTEENAKLQDQIVALRAQLEKKQDD
ncbi:unnamed protein product [Caenorhabditis bovis]|uniref:GPI inositol-deacylase n=1 Tax=Caenorhabditis bovis TaxID=2654633 RepID=A0A8S1E9X6_9PELO|nr:unnamed protein product [Caenorhabditis bovis]